MIDTFLSPLCNYNVLIVIGPIGCGKTTKVKEELMKFQDSYSADYHYNMDNIKVGVMTLDGRRIIRVIDPADNLDIPSEILKHPSKYILVCNSLKNLPEWCSSTKVMHMEVPLPTKNELLIALRVMMENIDPYASADYDFSEDDIPVIQNYHQLQGFILNSNAILQSSDSSLITRNFDDIIDKIRDGGWDGDVSIPSDRVLNRIVIYKEGIEYISLLDLFHNSGMDKSIISQTLKKIIIASPKLVPYKGVFVQRKKKEKVEEELEMGILDDPVSPAKALKVEKDKTSLFDF